jgi:hypothetical protein
MDLYPENEAKKLIKNIIIKIDKKNTYLTKNFDKVYPFIIDKYKIWKVEKSKWNSVFSELLHEELEFNPMKHEQHSTSSSKKTKKKHTPTGSNSLKGGFYFKSLESKGDKPITGDDIRILLDEIQGFFYNAKYTEEGSWLKEPDTLISLFRGDVDTFKFYLNYFILPKYYQLYPPFLKFGAIWDAIKNKKYEDYPDYLLAYLSYMKSKNAWEVEQGIAKPINYDATPFSQFATASDKLMTGVAQTRRKLLQPSSMKVVMGMPGGTFIG